MDGIDSEMFMYFKSLLIKGFHCVKQHLDDILMIVEVMIKDSKMPCFVKPKNVINEIKMRINGDGNEEDNECEYFELVERIVKGSANNWRTMQYDSYQKVTNGIWN